MKRISLLVAFWMFAATVYAQQATPMNPKYFAGTVAAYDASATQRFSGSAYYGYQLTNTTYMVSRTDFDVSVKNGLSVSCAQVGIYTILYQNKFLAFVASGNTGVSTNGSNVGACVGGEGGGVVNVHTFKNGLGWKLTAGYRDEKSSLAPNSKGLVFGSIVTFD